MKRYNDKYKNVYYEGKHWRLYDECTTNSLDAFYSETQIKIIELIEIYNFKIFYFTCDAATSNKLIIDNNGFIDLNTEDVKKIKSNQVKDFFYFYENRICEIFYSFLKLDKNNNYYFDFMLLVDKNFDLNSVYNYKFETIKILNVNEVTLNNVTFNFIKNIYEKRVYTGNNCVPIADKDHYSLLNLNYGFNNYVQNYKNGCEDFDYEEYINFNSIHFYKNYNQESYIKGIFKLLCSHI